MLDDKSYQLDSFWLPRLSAREKTRSSSSLSAWHRSTLIVLPLEIISSFSPARRTFYRITVERAADFSNAVVEHNLSPLAIRQSKNALEMILLPSLLVFASASQLNSPGVFPFCFFLSWFLSFA